MRGSGVNRNRPSPYSRALAVPQFPGKLVDLDDIGGHRGSRSARTLATFDTEVKDLLNRISQGKPGISGPRFPKNMRRQDYCGP